MFQLPDGTVGDAAGVLIFTFICLLANIVLIWLYWSIKEHWSFITLIGYFALLCTTSSIIQQFYNYTFWDDILWEQLSYIKANYENADVIFFNGNFGFMRALATIRLFCYLVESTYLLFYCIRVIMATSHYSVTKRNRGSLFAVSVRGAPIVMAAFMISLLQTPAVQSSFTAYLIVANIQSVVSCGISVLLLTAVIYKYVQSKIVWKRLHAAAKAGNLWKRIRDSISNDSSEDECPIESVHAAQGTVFDDNWVVVRLIIAVILISAFVVASIVTYLPQRDDIARDAKADAPDLGPERARSNIIGYIPGISPGLAIWIVFGFTRDFRHIMYNTFVPRMFRRRSSVVPGLDLGWSPADDMVGVTVDTGLRLDNVNPGTKRRPLADTFDAPVLASAPEAVPAKGTENDRNS